MEIRRTWSRVGGTLAILIMVPASMWGQSQGPNSPGTMTST